jgi:sugar phosphate isomerase/epimerase
MNKNWFEAEALLKKSSPQGKGVDKMEDTNLQRHFQPPQKLLNILKDLNLQIVALSPYSISIAGSKEVFEKVFKVNLDIKELVEKSLSIPSELAEFVDEIHLQSPPTYF